MERLTKKTAGGYVLKMPTDKSISDLEIKFNVYDKLGEYEDAEEQGLLLRLPCKVGSELYVILKLCDGKETRVIENVIANSFDLRALQRFVITSNGHRLNFSNFGKTVFLTKEEAEQALKQMGE